MIPLHLLLIPILFWSHLHARGHYDQPTGKEEIKMPSYETYEDFWEYIVIGAGPAGLQMGYFLEKAGRNYVILERANVSGSFFMKYPRHDKLISINKRYTGQSNREFNFRHDWNSLISDDDQMLFKHYSRDFFPHRETLLNYLSDFTSHWGLKVKYNVDVSGIHKTEDGAFMMTDQNGSVYRCRTLLVATGMWKPNIPPLEGIGVATGYEEISTDPEHYEGKTVLILGKGNAAFEVAASVYGSANVVHLLSGSRVRLSWQTHYVGDIRGVNNEVLDSYQLKSLDGVIEGPLQDMSLKRQGDKITVGLREDLPYDNFALRQDYDCVIRCLGWTFDDTLFTNKSLLQRAAGRLRKYPLIGPDHRVEGQEGLYVIGTAAHSLDHRKSAGGFIHGLRYTVRAVHRLLEHKNHGTVWPSTTLHFMDIVSAVVKRVNEASGIYQMFGVLVDVISLNRATQTARYFEEFPVKLLPKFYQRTGHHLQECIVLVLEYGKNFSGPGKDVFYQGRSVGQAERAHRSNFLHPVFYYYKTPPRFLRSPGHRSRNDFRLPTPDRLHHSVEDFLGFWDTPISHILPLRRFMEYSSGSDLRTVFADVCFRLTFFFKDLPLSCSEHYLKSRGLLTPVIATSR